MLPAEWEAPAARLLTMETARLLLAAKALHLPVMGKARLRHQMAGNLGLQKYPT